MPFDSSVTVCSQYNIDVAPVCTGDENFMRMLPSGDYQANNFPALKKWRLKTPCTRWPLDNPKPSDNHVDRRDIAMQSNIHSAKFQTAQSTSNPDQMSGDLLVAKAMSFFMGKGFPSLFRSFCTVNCTFSMGTWSDWRMRHPGSL